MTMRNPNSIDSRRHESAARLDTAFARCGSRSSYGRRQSPRPTADGWLSLSCDYLRFMSRRTCLSDFAKATSRLYPLNSNWTASRTTQSRQKDGRALTSLASSRSFLVWKFIGFPFCDSSYHGRWGMSGVKFPNGYVGNNGNYGKTDAGCECEVADG